MFVAALTLLIAWGVFAFGAVYPWAYWPLLAGITVIGLAALVSTRDRRASMPKRVVIGLTIVAVAVFAQLVPLPTRLLSLVSPATVNALRQLDFSFSASPDRHALSVDPHATAVTLAFVVALTILLASATRVFSALGTRAIGGTICALGAAVAITAIAQRAVNHTHRIYGVWTPEQSQSFYGPFVNRNHFAGWMMMAMSVALGYFAGRLARALRGVEGGWRERLLWWSTPAANQLLLIGAAILLMAASLLLSLSRSGVTCALLAFAVMGQAMATRQTGAIRKTAGVAFLAALIVVIAAWIGTDAIAKRFAAPELSAGRREAWADAASVARDFWPAGSGLNTYGRMMFLYQRHIMSVHFDQAHNDYLQLLAEGGILVTVPAAVTMALFVSHVRRRFAEDDRLSMSHWVRAGAVTGLVAIALQEAVDFSLQMPGNALLFTVLCAIALHDGTSRTDRSSLSRLVSA